MVPIIRKRIDEIVKDAQRQITEECGISGVVSFAEDVTALTADALKVRLVVLEVVGVSETLLCSKTRQYKVTLARKLIVYIARRNTHGTLSLGDLAKLVGLGDHTSALHCYQTAADWHKMRDDNFCAYYGKCLKRLGIKEIETNV